MPRKKKEEPTITINKPCDEIKETVDEEDQEDWISKTISRENQHLKTLLDFQIQEIVLLKKMLQFYMYDK